MTVGDLIKELTKYNPDLPVYFMGKHDFHYLVDEVSLFDSDSPHSVDNPLSITI